MITSVFNRIQVSGIMTAVPAQRETLADAYDAVFGRGAVAQFSRTTGVVERRLAAKQQTASDFAFVAARELLREKHVDPAEVGVLIFVTQTPDYPIPSTACVLHKRLGLPKDCIAFDVNLGCSGYVYGVEIIGAIMQAINCRYGLLLVGDTSSKRVAPEDQSVVMLFGDGGSATLFEGSEGGKAIRTAYRTDGGGYKAIIIPAGGYRNQTADPKRVIWADGNKRSDYDLYMSGVDVFSFTISEVPDLICEFLEGTGDNRSRFDCFAFHQANCFILKQVIKRCGLPGEKVPISMDRYGNTSVTSIPLTLCDYYGPECKSETRQIFACGFGIGLSWGIVTMEVDQKDIYPIIETEEFYEDGGVSHD